MCSDEDNSMQPSVDSVTTTVPYVLGTEIATGNLGGPSPAPWSLYDSGILIVGPGTIQMPDNTNTLNQSRFPAAIRPDILQIVFTGPIIVGTSLHDLFNGLMNLSMIENIDYLDTSATTNMRRVFYNTSSLVGPLDLSMWNTSNVTNMYRMFANSGVHALNLGGSFNNPSAVINLGSMFWGASNLTTIGDVSNWTTGNATRMSRMFQSASSLVDLDPSAWDTSNVTLMYNMFSAAQSLTTLDLSSWDTSNVVRMDSMFSNMINLTYLNVSGWDTGNVAQMQNMFDGAHNLVELDLSSFDTSSVVNRMNMLRANGLRVLILGPNWYWLAIQSSGLPGVPNNEIWRGTWQNVSDPGGAIGTYLAPRGTLYPTSIELMNNSLFPNNIANTWVWSPRVSPLIVFFAAENGTVSLDWLLVPVTQPPSSGQIPPFSITATPYPNFIFSHWISSEGEIFNTTEELLAEVIGRTINNDITFTAIFIPIPTFIVQIITFNPNKGVFAGGDQLLTREISSIGTYTRAFDTSGNLLNPNLVHPTRSGYIFDGWFDTQANADGTTQAGRVLSTDNVTNEASRTLWARWTPA